MLRYILLRSFNNSTMFDRMQPSSKKVYIKQAVKRNCYYSLSLLLKQNSTVFVGRSYECNYHMLFQQTTFGASWTNLPYFGDFNLTGKNLTK